MRLRRFCLVGWFSCDSWAVTTKKFPVWLKKLFFFLNINKLLTTSSSLLTCWNINEAKTNPDIWTVGSAILLPHNNTATSQESPFRKGCAWRGKKKTKRLRLLCAARHHEVAWGACPKSAAVTGHPTEQDVSLRTVILENTEIKFTDKGRIVVSLG